MLELAAENSKVCAITAAMPGGTGLLKFRQQFPNRLFDVGIAEEHAVSMSGGLAKQGMVPIVALYSTFLQRAYDQIIQDVALLGLHVVFAIDRAGLVGEDGPTHHGVFDVGFLRKIPGMTVLCPSNFDELRKMLRWAVNECTGPVAVRYPRGHAECGASSRFCGDISYVHTEQTADNDEATLITYGPIMVEALDAVERLKEKNIHIRLLVLGSATHYSESLLCEKICGQHVFVVEEVCSGSGISEAVAMCLRRSGLTCIVHPLDLGNNFVPHGEMTCLYRHTGLDSTSISDYICGVLQNED